MIIVKNLNQFFMNLIDLYLNKQLKMKDINAVLRQYDYKLINRKNFTTIAWQDYYEGHHMYNCKSNAYMHGVVEWDKDDKQFYTYSDFNCNHMLNTMVIHLHHITHQ